MGGHGSGSWRVARHATIERCAVLRVRDLLPELRSRSNPAQPTSITVSSRVTRGQTLALVPSRPHFGGVRWWIVCGCRRRVDTVYLPPGSSFFACRRCHQLAYATQRMSRAGRSQHRATKFWRKIGEDTLWPVERARGTRRPKWMRRATYWRIRAQANELDRLALEISCPRWIQRLGR